MKKIPLTRGLFAIVDDEDYELLSSVKWYARKGRKTFYANRQSGGRKNKYTICMHRLIMSAPDDKVVDHINGNGLDNRKSNLRLCTHYQNKLNGKLYKNNTSGYKGVYLRKETGNYKARINYKRKTFELGEFKSKVDAAKAYDAKAKELFGIFARLNFPE